MKKLFLPINLLILYLFLLAFTAAFLWSGNALSEWLLHGRNLLLLFTGGLLVRFTLSRLWKKQAPFLVFRIEHRIITTLILFLLFDITTPWYIFFLLGILTELGQCVWRAPGSPLFNPGALGALTVTMLGFYPSWWGANFPPRFSLPGGAGEVSIALILTLTLGLLVASRYRKLPLILSAIASFAVIYPLLLGQSPLYIVLEGTFLFFLIVMCTEPKTSPAIPKEQRFYGALIGAMLALGLFFHFFEAYLIALLVGNIYTKRQLWLDLFR